MAEHVTNNYSNPLTSDIEAIDAAGLDYGSYDKNNHILDFLQDLWGYTIGGDSNWGDSQLVDNREKAEDYANQFFDGGTDTYELGTDDYIVADKIKNMYDVDESKGIGFLTGAANWLGDQIYDNATKSDESRKILTQLMQGGTTFDMQDSDGNAVTYNLGKDIYDAILNDDYDYVDNVLRTVGSDLARSGKSWDDLDSNTMRDLGLNYNVELARTNGNYEANRDAAQKGETSPLVIGNREGSTKLPIFNENGKYNALAGNNNAANALDIADMVATAASMAIPVGGLINAGTKGANIAAKAANGVSKAANAAKNASNAASSSAKGKIGQNISNMVNNHNRNADIKKMQKSYSKAEKNASKANNASNGNQDLALYDKNIANIIVDGIKNGRTFNPVTDADKATLNVLKGSSSPKSKNGIIGNAKNVGKFMTRPKNIILGNSTSDVVTTPFEEYRRDTQNKNKPNRYTVSTKMIDGYIPLQMKPSGFGVGEDY